MIIEEEVNGMIFVEQRTYYIYSSKEDQKEDKWLVSTSNEDTYLKIKHENKKNESTNATKTDAA